MKKFATKGLAGALSLAMVFGVTLAAAPKTASAKVNVKKVTATSPSGKTLYVAKGKKVKITATVKVTPNKTANKKVTYKSANKKIATVSSKGYVKGVKAGTTKVTVTSKKNSKKKATIKVVVKKAAVKKVTLNAKTATLAVGGKKTLKATISPTKNVSKKVAWSTSNKKIATVSSKGVVKGVKEGKATITAKAADGSGKKATCKVTVGAGIASLSVVNNKVLRVTLTSAKELTAANFTVQNKKTPSGKYTTTESIERVTTADKKTYDVVLDTNSSIASYSYVNVTIPVLSVNKSKEIYVAEVPDYDSEYTAQETVEFITGTVGDTYNATWYEDVPTTGYVKRTVTGLPAGLKAYVSKDGSTVRVAGKYTSVLEGTTATLTATDESGKTYTKKYLFYVGDKNRLVGTVIAQDQLAYVPDDPNVAGNDASGLDIESYVYRINNSSYSTYGTRFIIGGGSGSYKYELTSVPAALGEYKTDEDGERSFYAKTDASGKMAAVPAGTYNFTVKVSDSSDANINGTISYNLNLVQGVTFTGTVKDAAGAPARYVLVSGSTKKDMYGNSDDLGVTTKADGTYRTRVMPGDYEIYTYVNGVQSNTSSGNVFNTGAAAKNFDIPQFCVKFTTGIAGAGAYDYYDDEEGIDLMNSYGSTAEGIQIDYRADHSMYAYLRAGSYELLPVKDSDSYRNMVYAYSKYTANKDSYNEDWASVSSEDRLGRYRLSGSFNVTGNTTVQLTGTEYKPAEN